MGCQRNIKKVIWMHTTTKIKNKMYSCIFWYGYITDRAVNYVLLLHGRFPVASKQKKLSYFNPQWQTLCANGGRTTVCFIHLYTVKGALCSLGEDIYNQKRKVFICWFFKFFFLILKEQHNFTKFYFILLWWPYFPLRAACLFSYGKIYISELVL